MDLAVIALCVAAVLFCFVPALTTKWIYRLMQMCFLCSVIGLSVSQNSFWAVVSLLIGMVSALYLGVVSIINCPPKG